MKILESEKKTQEIWWIGSFLQRKNVYQRHGLVGGVAWCVFFSKKHILHTADRYKNTIIFRIANSRAKKIIVREELACGISYLWSFRAFVILKLASPIACTVKQIKQFMPPLLPVNF